MADETGQELTSQTQEHNRRKTDILDISDTKEKEDLFAPSVSLTSLLQESKGIEEEKLKNPEAIIEEQNRTIEMLQKHVDALTEKGRTDTQTGLLNKNAYLEDLYPALVQAFRQGKKVGLISLDLQGLKEINDTQGHEAGDELIAKFGLAVKTVTQERMRETDRGYRVGGDENVILLFDIDQDGLETAANDYKELFNQQDIRTGIGAGMIDTTGLDTMLESMSEIDGKLYESKREAYDTKTNNIKLVSAAA